MIGALAEGRLRSGFLAKKCSSHAEASANCFCTAHANLL